MNELTKLLNENKSGYLATIEAGKPRVRPFEFQLEDGGKYYFCTANTKEVYKQLKENPIIEFSSTSKDFVTIRLGGKIKFSDDYKIKESVIQSNELVKSIYKTADNPAFEIFYMESGEGVVSDFSGNPPKKYNF